MKAITFDLCENPAPMSDPIYNFHWKPGQWDRPKPFKEWSDALDRYLKNVIAAADRAMKCEPRLLDGYVTVNTVFVWKRPGDHYSSNGSVKEAVFDTLPAPSNYHVCEMQRGVLWAMERRVYYSRTQVAQQQSTRIWGVSHKTLVTVSQVAPRDLDPKLQQLPEQMELGL